MEEKCPRRLKVKEGNRLLIGAEIHRLKENISLLCFLLSDRPMCACVRGLAPTPHLSLSGASSQQQQPLPIMSRGVYLLMMARSTNTS
jgi:hypothetical protein